MRAELLTIGAELMSGSTLNTNAAYLAQQLAALGIPCQRQVAVSDEPGALTRALQDALQHCDLLITTGGLGPTFDDLTIEQIAHVTGRPLIYHPSVAVTIRRFYTRRHRSLQRAALRQAYLPEGGIALPNPLGTAPGVWLSLGPQTIVALPGVPREMRALMEHQVIPRLKQLGSAQAIESVTLRTAGLVELSIEEILKTLRIPEHVSIGLYPHLRMVDIQLTATAISVTTAQRTLRRLEQPLRRALGPSLYGTNDDTLEGVVGALLVKQHKTLAMAESCTGGLLSDRITEISGSSQYLRGSVVAYHNDLKRDALAVPPATLERFGAVSAQTAAAMAKGIRAFARADVGLSVTGIAGPTGGSPKKPVGLVYLGVADQRKTETLRCQFFGDRTAIKLQAAQTALDWLRRYLQKKGKSGS